MSYVNKLLTNYFRDNIIVFTKLKEPKLEELNLLTCIEHGRSRGPGFTVNPQRKAAYRG